MGGGGRVGRGSDTGACHTGTLPLHILQENKIEPIKGKHKIIEPGPNKVLLNKTKSVLVKKL